MSGVVTEISISAMKHEHMFQIVKTAFGLKKIMLYFSDLKR